MTHYRMYNEQLSKTQLIAKIENFDDYSNTSGDGHDNVGFVSVIFIFNSIFFSTSVRILKISQAENNLRFFMS